MNLSEVRKNATLRKKLTRKEFAAGVQNLLANMAELATPFVDDSQGARQERLKQAKANPFYFFKTYLPHYFSCKFAPFHYELVGLLEDRPTGGAVKPVICAAPREFAKTTVTSFGYVLQQTVFALRHFVMLISDTQDLASDLASYAYLELCYNERIIQDFGKLVMENINAEDFTTLNDVRIKSRGRGQRVRGLKHKQFRPDLIVLDDLENEESAGNRDRVKSLLKWITGSIYPAIDQQKGNLFIIGTLLSKKSALHTMVFSNEEPWNRWERRVYRAIHDGDSLWPDKFPLSTLERQKELMGTTAFNREKLNLPEDEDAVFRLEWLREYKTLPDNLIIGGWFDPSIEHKAHSDYKAVVTVGMDLATMTFYVLDVLLKRISVEQAIHYVYENARDYPYMVFGIETNLFQKLLIKEFEEAGRLYQRILPIRGVDNFLTKEIRISGISPLVERGQILFDFSQGDQALLKEQLLYFPDKSVHDDGPDALEGVIRLLRELPGRRMDYETVAERRERLMGAY